MKYKNDNVFESVAEYAAYVDALPRAKGAGDRSETHEPTHSWDLGLGRGPAIEYASGAKIWTEGAERIVEGIATAEAMRAPLETTTIGSDVAGFMPDVPAYLAGVPECMRTFETTESPSEIVSIGLTGFTCNTSADAMLNRGIALLSLVDVLESSGYRCEIVADFAIAGRNTLRSRIYIKRAGDHWDPTSAAFAMAHPAFFRRLFLKDMEGYSGLNKTTNSGYGTSPLPKPDEYTFALDYTAGDHGWYTLENALYTAEQMAARAGIEVELTTWR
jgi:hypothetical protein